MYPWINLHCFVLHLQCSRKVFTERNFCKPLQPKLVGIQFACIFNIRACHSHFNHDPVYGVFASVATVADANFGLVLLENQHQQRGRALKFTYIYTLYNRPTATISTTTAAIIIFSVVMCASMPFYHYSFNLIFTLCANKFDAVYLFATE